MELYEHHRDAIASASKEIQAQQNIKCEGKGCYGCCYQKTMTSEAQTVALLNWLQNEGWNIREGSPFQKRLKSFARSETRFLDPDDYFTSRVGCVFLHPTSYECSVYPVRPINCAMYGVTSDPKDCYPSKDTGEINCFDTAETEIRYIEDLAAKVDFDDDIVMGLATALLAVIRGMEQDEDDRYIPKKGAMRKGLRVLCKEMKLQIFELGE